MTKSLSMWRRVQLFFHCAGLLYTRSSKACPRAFVTNLALLVTELAQVSQTQVWGNFVLLEMMLSFSIVVINMLRFSLLHFSIVLFLHFFSHSHHIHQPIRNVKSTAKISYIDLFGTYNQLSFSAGEIPHNTTYLGE